MMLNAVRLDHQVQRGETAASVVAKTSAASPMSISTTGRPSDANATACSPIVTLRIAPLARSPRLDPLLLTAVIFAAGDSDRW